MADKILFSTDKVDLRASTIQLRKDGIMHIDLKPVDEFMLEDLLDTLRVIGDIGKGKKFPNLVTIKQFVQINVEVRQFSAKEESNIYTLADAFVINSLPLKLIGNFYVSYNKPVRPTRIFNSEDKAVEWLKTFL